MNFALHLNNSKRYSVARALSINIRLYNSNLKPDVYTNKRHTTYQPDKQWALLKKSAQPVSKEKYYLTFFILRNRRIKCRRL